jgi:hypothetical protein
MTVPSLGQFVMDLNEMASHSEGLSEAPWGSLTEAPSGIRTEEPWESPKAGTSGTRKEERKETGEGCSAKP